MPRMGKSGLVRFKPAEPFRRERMRYTHIHERRREYQRKQPLINIEAWARLLTALIPDSGTPRRTFNALLLLLNAIITSLPLRQTTSEPITEVAQTTTEEISTRQEPITKATPSIILATPVKTNKTNTEKKAIKVSQKKSKIINRPTPLITPTDTIQSSGESTISISTLKSPISPIEEKSPSEITNSPSPTEILITRTLSNRKNKKAFKPIVEPIKISNTLNPEIIFISYLIEKLKKLIHNTQVMEKIALREREIFAAQYYKKHIQQLIVNLKKLDINALNSIDLKPLKDEVDTQIKALQTKIKKEYLSSLDVKNIENIENTIKIISNIYNKLCIKTCENYQDHLFTMLPYYTNDHRRISGSQIEYFMEVHAEKIKAILKKYEIPAQMYISGSIIFAPDLAKDIDIVIYPTTDHTHKEEDNKIRIAFNEIADYFAEEKVSDGLLQILSKAEDKTINTRICLIKYRNFPGIDLGICNAPIKQALPQRLTNLTAALLKIEDDNKISGQIQATPEVAELIECESIVFCTTPPENPSTCERLLQKIIDKAEESLLNANAVKDYLSSKGCALTRSPSTSTAFAPHAGAGSPIASPIHLSTPSV